MRFPPPSASSILAAVDAVKKECGDLMGTLYEQDHAGELFALGRIGVEAFDRATAEVEQRRQQVLDRLQQHAPLLMLATDRWSLGVQALGRLLAEWSPGAERHAWRGLDGASQQYDLIAAELIDLRNKALAETAAERLDSVPRTCEVLDDGAPAPGLPAEALAIRKSALCKVYEVAGFRSIRDRLKGKFHEINEQTVEVDLAKFDPRMRAKLAAAAAAA